MSTLDQAFIRAYRKGIGAPAPHHRPATPLPTGGDTRYQAIDAVPHDQVPEPHADFAVERAAPEAPNTAAANLAATRQAIATHATAANVVAAPVGGHHAAALEPAFEVTHFIWPALVDNLLAQAPLPCASCGAQLMGRSAQQRKVTLVTAGERGQGCSTAALVIARSVARRGLRVVLVDADLRHPQLSELLGVAANVSWGSVLAENAEVGPALIESSWERITLMPLVAGDTRRHSPPNLAATLALLRKHYDLVLLDAGALDDDSAAIELAGVLLGSTIDDGVIVHAGSDLPAEIARPLARRLTAAGVRRWEIVENFVRNERR